MKERKIIDDQIEYYRRRAPDYDDWWNSQGIFDFGPDVTESFQREVDAVTRWADSADIRGDVLELAAGTGIWTSYLLDRADSLTAVDASPETLEINRARTAGGRVEYVVADLFSWQPEREYDTVFFSFWLSHVPEVSFADFWAMVGSATKRNGLVVVIDNAHPHYSMLYGPEIRQSELIKRTGNVWNLQQHTSRRHIGDDEYYTIVKRYWKPDELAAAIEPLGWDGRFVNTDWAFLCGTANPRRLPSRV